MQKATYPMMTRPIMHDHLCVTAEAGSSADTSGSNAAKSNSLGSSIVRCLQRVYRTFAIRHSNRVKIQVSYRQISLYTHPENGTCKLNCLQNTVRRARPQIQDSPPAEYTSNQRRFHHRRLQEYSCMRVPVERIFVPDTCPPSVE